MKKTIKSNHKLTAHSVCDHDCIFTLNVITRKGNWATVEMYGKVKRTKIFSDLEGNEYLRPESYSMAPYFKAIN